MDKDTNNSGIPRYRSSFNYKPNKSPYDRPLSIMDAYNQGLFGRSQVDEGLEEGSDDWNAQNEEVQRAKNNRDYMILDSISKGLRGLGKDVSNVGAAFTGGTIQDSTPDTSLWQARNNELIKQGVTSEEKNIAGSDAAMNAANSEAGIMGKYKDLSSKELALEMDNMKLIMPREYRQLYENADSIGNPLLRSAVRGSAAVMLNKYVNGGTVEAGDIIASIVANGGNELAEEAKKNGKTVEQYVGDAIKEIAGGLKDSMSPTFNINANINPFGGEKKGANPYQAEAAYTGLTDSGNAVDEKTYNSIMSKYGLKDNGDVDDLREQAYKSVYAQDPKLWDMVMELSQMNPKQRDEWAKKMQAGNKLLASGRRAQEALNLARILGYDVSYQNYQ